MKTCTLCLDRSKSVFWHANSVWAFRWAYNSIYTFDSTISAVHLFMLSGVLYIYLWICFWEVLHVYWLWQCLAIAAVAWQVLTCMLNMQKQNKKICQSQTSCMHTVVGLIAAAGIPQVDSVLYVQWTAIVSVDSQEQSVLPAVAVIVAVIARWAAAAAPQHMWTLWGGLSVHELHRTLFYLDGWRPRNYDKRRNLRRRYGHRKASVQHVVRNVLPRGQAAFRFSATDSWLYLRCSRNQAVPIVHSWGRRPSRGHSVLPTVYGTLSSCFQRIWQVMSRDIAFSKRLWAI